MIVPTGIWLLWAWSLLGAFSVDAATYKMALVGPWECDTLFERALPGVAVNLALSRIHKDPTMIRSFYYDVAIVTEPCSTSQALQRFSELEGYGQTYLGPFNPALCSAASLLASHWKAGVASPGCLNEDWPSLAPLPSASRILFSVLSFFRWAHVGVVCAPTELWESTGQELASALRAMGVPVGPVVTMDPEGSGAVPALQAIMKHVEVEVVIMCMSSVLIGGHHQRELLLAAVDLGMVEDGYTFLPYDTLLYALPYQDGAQAELSNHTRLRRAYDAVVTITMDSEASFHAAYRTAQSTGELHTSVPAHQVSPLFGTIYNAVYFIAKAVEERRQAKPGRWVLGEELVHSRGGFDFRGFNQMVFAGEDGEGMQTRYVLLDSDGGDYLRPTHTVTQGPSGRVRPMGWAIHFPGGAPSTSAYCWFYPDVACTAMVSLASLVGYAVYFILLFGTAWFVYQRAYGEKIPRGVNCKLILSLDDIVFINTKLSKTKLSEENIMKSLLDLKTPIHSVCSKSFITASPDSSNIAMMEGDWVWVKKCPNGETVKEVNNETRVLFSNLRELRHENLLLYLGLFHGAGVFCMVMEFCPRGSLSDLLADEDLRLDWMFKSSLLMDLIKGMKFLHMRDLCHGRMKSRNCLVDGRFVLKVSDYGYPLILTAQDLSIPEEPEDLLWTAPELLRKPVVGGTFAGDVFSFSIITHEVISRTPPYASLDMPDQEIIDRVRSPPPLLRPYVSVDEAPMECITLMQQCWSEAPDERPNFQEIFKMFKNINRGKRANIIDSMLRMLEQYSSNLEDLIRERTDELEVERAKTDKLVGQLLPRSVALALKKGKTVQPEHFAECTLYFSDIVGFTTISALSEPMEVVNLLNDLYTMFDAILALHDVYKVETIGDAYMVSSGVPTRSKDIHAAEVSNMSLDILHGMGTFQIKHMPDIKVKIRIGLHSGPVVAGVVGLTMPRYCLFGDTVMIASFMESSGLPYRIQISGSTQAILLSLNQGYKFETRPAQVAGVADTYWLSGRDGFDKPLPTPPDLLGGKSHGISLEEIPPDRRQKFLDRQARQMGTAKK